MTLPKDCKCPCHKAPHAVVHVHPCCGPGSQGWPPEIVFAERDPYERVTLFPKDTRNKLPDVAPPVESGGERS